MVLRFLSCEIDHVTYLKLRERKKENYMTFWQIHKMTAIFIQNCPW